MTGKLEKRRALWEERVAEEVTNLTLHREAGTEIRSHMADQNLKLGKYLTKQSSQTSISFCTHITFTFTFYRFSHISQKKLKLPKSITSERSLKSFHSLPDKS